MKITRRILVISGSLITLAGVLLSLHWFDRPIFNLLAILLRHPEKSSWPLRLHQASIALLALGLFSIAVSFVLPAWPGFRQAAMDQFRRFQAWQEHQIGKWIDYKSQAQPVKFKWPVLRWLDWVILSVFLIYSLLLFIGKIQGNFPNFLLSGDAGNTASFAAGFDHPTWFKGDMLLNQTGNIAVYSTFNVYFMRWLAPYLGGYPLALTLLIPLQVFFFLAGFYWFGRIFFGSTLWAAAFCALLAFPIGINLGEAWGLILDPVARFNFQAFLPFVLCMVLVWRDRPARWPWIMAATGLLFYFHPVSTPSWAAAIWLGLWFSSPKAWSLWKRLGIMIGMGLIFLLVAFPYILTYFSNHMQGTSPNYALVYKIINVYMPANLINVPGALLDFLGIITRSGLLPFAILGLIINLLFLRANPKTYLLIFSWMLGILLTAVLLPWVMHTYERMMRLVPTETELVRGIRYFIPFLLLFCLWPFYEISRIIRSRKAAAGITLAALVFVAIWGFTFPLPVDPVSQAVTCLSQGKLVCVQSSDYEEALQAVSANVPQGAPIYATFSDDSLLAYGLPIRYIALHPLVYAYKDRSQLVYSNHQALNLWNDTYQAVNDIENNVHDPQMRFESHLEIAKRLGAQYMITHFDFALTSLDSGQVSVVYTNPSFKILKIE
jgi:hypothetical protein